MVVSSTDAKHASRHAWLAKAGEENSFKPIGMRSHQPSPRVGPEVSACDASLADILSSGVGFARLRWLDVTPGSCRQAHMRN